MIGVRFGEIPTTGGKQGNKQSERIVKKWLVNTGQLIQLYVYVNCDYVFIYGNIVGYLCIILAYLINYDKL